MTLMSALSAAMTGLRATQAGMNVVSQNVANAGSPGYTKRRTLPVEAVAGGRSAGVRTGEVQRVLDTVLQRQLRQENSGAGYTAVRANMAGALDRLYGAPGTASALDTLMNGFAGALDRLVDDPASAAARNGVLDAARAATRRINQIATGVQALRTEAEGRIASGVAQADELLQGIERVNQSIVSSSTRSAALEDERDRLIDQLSRLVDVRVMPADAGAVTITTGSGQTLFDGARAVRLTFDARSTLGPDNLAGSDPQSVGIIRAAGGALEVDLVQAGAFRSGMIGAALEMRDVTLVQAQAQLDTLAAGIAARVVQPGAAPGDPPLFALFNQPTGPNQPRGFAQMIAVATTNPAELVAGMAGDATRPQALRAGLDANITFPATLGLAGNAVFEASALTGARRIIEVQGAAAEAAARLDEGQRVALAAVEGRFSEISGVDIDEEMTQLVMLQTAYGANARVMTAVREMLETLMRI